MKIVIDARMLYWTGVGRYTQALLENLESLDRDNEYIVLMRRDDWQLWEPRAGNFRKLETNINPYTFGEQLRLAKLLWSLKPDLVHFTTPNAPILYSGRRVVTIHDLILLDFDTSRGSFIERWLRRSRRWPFRLVMWADVRWSAAILAPTEYIKNQVVRRYRIDPDKVNVTLLAAKQDIAEPEPIDRFNIGDEFILNVGNAYPYKVGKMIEGFALVAEKYPNLKLVMTCKPDYFRSALEERVKKLGVTDRVVFTGFVSNGELVTLYKKARLYLYPSLAEGFGLQGLEAMAQGTPVLAARATCLPEVCGDAGAYFDPTSPEDMARQMDAILSSKTRREQMREAGYARVKHFSWERTARQTLAVYQKALDQGRA